MRFPAFWSKGPRRAPCRREQEPLCLPASARAARRLLAPNCGASGFRGISQPNEPPSAHDGHPKRPAGWKTLHQSTACSLLPSVSPKKRSRHVPSASSAASSPGQLRAVRFPELCSAPWVPALCSAQGHDGNLPESASSLEPGRQRADSSPCCRYGESGSPSASGWKSNHAVRSCGVRSHSGDRATCRAGIGISSAPQKPHTRLWGEGNQRHLLLPVPTNSQAASP